MFNNTVYVSFIEYMHALGLLGLLQKWSRDTIIYEELMFGLSYS